MRYLLEPNTTLSCMKSIKVLLYFLSFALIPLSMVQCGSAQTNLHEMPIQINEAYYQSWIAGVQGGGSGINLFITIQQLPSDIQLENAFFQKKIAKLRKENDTLLVARFLTDLNRERDIVMSDNPIEESVNTPQETPSFPFPLADNEAGVSYMQEGVLKYSKILNITEKETIAYPSAPPKDRGY